MNLLIAETESIKVITESAGSVHYIVNYRDENTLDGYKDNVSEDIITTATTTTIVSAPSSGFRKKIYQVSIFNNGASNTITIYKEGVGTFIYHKCTLLPGESIKMIGDIVEVFDFTGKKKGENLLDQYNGRFDAFYRERTSQPETIFDSKQINDKQPQFWDDQQVSGSGTASTYNTNQASTTLSVSNLTAGKRVRQTFRRFNYQPGKSMLVKKTFKIETKKTGIKIKDGYFDDNNGLFFYTHSDAYGFGVRTKTSGSSVTNLIPQTDWNIDKLDGFGPSGLNLSDYKKALFFVDFEWLGVGVIAFGFYFNRKPVYCHFYDTAMDDEFVTMSTPNLPCRTEIENDGTGAAASTTHICSTVISEGGLKDTGFPYGATRGSTALTTNNDTNIYPLMAMRLKSGYLSSLIKILDLSITCTSTASFNYYILLNPTVTGTALSFSTPANIANSSIEVDVSRTNATTVSGGTLLYCNTDNQANNTSGKNSILNSDFALGSTIAGVSDIIVIGVQRTTGTTETFYGSINWKDQQ